MPTEATDDNAGFTVLEALIAFIILAAALTMAIQAFTQSTVYASRSHQDQALILRGRVLLAELLSTTAAPSHQEGTINGLFSWTWEVGDTGNEISKRDLLRYRLSISDSRRERPVAIYVGTFGKYDPPQN